MWKKVFLVLFALAFAFTILLISVLRSASVKYSFNPAEKRLEIIGENYQKVDYRLPYPGKVLPDGFLWPLKALRDRVWLAVNTNPNREAELILLFADKRLGSALLLFEEGKVDIGISTLTKAEKYLEEALVNEQENISNGRETKELMQNIAKAALKHYEIVSQITVLAPDVAKPQVIEIADYPQKVYEDARNNLLGRGLTAPENPFFWQ